MIEPKTSDAGPEREANAAHLFVLEHEENAEPLDLQVGSETAAGDEDAQERVHGLLREYAEELRQRQVVVDTEPSRRVSGLVYWGLGTLSVILVAAFTVLLLQPESDAARALRLRDANRCRERQAEVMRAIGRYTRDHGRPPAGLETLRPGYLTEPAVDPVSGLPYRYTVQGEIMSLSCPNHLLPTQPSPQAGVGRAPASRSLPAPSTPAPRRLRPAAAGWGEVPSSRSAGTAKVVRFRPYQARNHTRCRLVSPGA